LVTVLLRVGRLSPSTAVCFSTSPRCWTPSLRSKRPFSWRHSFWPFRCV